MPVSCAGINNTYACEDPVTLGWLKQGAGFDGWVMSDWGADHDSEFGCFRASAQTKLVLSRSSTQSL